MEIRVCAPSYKRPEAILTKKYLPFVKYYVDQSESEAYRKANPDQAIVSCPKGVQGNVSRIRNFILDQEFESGADVVVLLDDDLSGIFYWENMVKLPLTSDRFFDFVQEYSLLCYQFGFKYWGINVSQDKQIYRENTPFSTVSYIGAPFQCFLKGGQCRYDERLPLKEDYDMTLQQINMYRGCLRVNKFFYVAKQSVQKGGCATYRNIETEKDQLLKLVEKWGSKIVRIDKNLRSHNLKSIKRRIDYNPIINVPIPGV